MRPLIDFQKLNLVESALLSLKPTRDLVVVPDLTLSQMRETSRKSMGSICRSQCVCPYCGRIIYITDEPTSALFSVSIDYFSHNSANLLIEFSVFPGFTFSDRFFHHPSIRVRPISRGQFVQDFLRRAKQGTHFGAHTSWGASTFEAKNFLTGFDIASTMGRSSLFWAIWPEYGHLGAHVAERFAGALAVDSLRRRH
jgi:hypothetical protein